MSRYTRTIGAKGQFTVPKAVREALGLAPGVRVDFYPTDEGFLAIPHRPSKIMDFVGDLDQEGP